MLILALRGLPLSISAGIGLEPVIEAILAEARTGRAGDGRIFVHGVLECVRIRTSERGGEAL